jgi:Protein of unknown function (DUF4232)
VVALLVALALGLATPTHPATRVIPWLDVRPVKEAAHPPLAPACDAARLHARLFLQGETGSLAGYVELTNAGQAPCSLIGRPRVSLSGPAASRERWAVEDAPRAPQPLEVLADPLGSLRALAPGKTATVFLVWSNWCGPGATAADGRSGALPHGIDLRLPGGSTVVVPVTWAPRCDQPSNPSTLSSTPFSPAVRELPEGSRLPLSVALAGWRPTLVKPGLHAFRARRGETLSFQVVLTNTGATTFHFASARCPVYLEQVVPAPAQEYVLNCRPIGAIAPHASVRFEMKAAIPSGIRAGLTLVSWDLAPTTYLSPSAGAPVSIDP